ncbi:MAG: copper homeostasis protein CutC, partial [Bauldia sp.]|nr:copper homeostasis protein CutC [Bauldia sp.]
HRAFDMTPDPIAALETLIELGVDRVLTTGQAPTLLEGAELIRELVRVADNRIIVMPGGINERTAARVIEFTGAREYHFAALTPTASGMQFRRHDVFMGGELRPPEYDRLDTHVQPVASIIAAAGKARI